jgi:pimeloyl-ACP methyl ester carboxylesterase
MNTQHLDVNGGRIAYDEQGPQDGQLVLCLHGLGDTRRIHRFLAPRLAAAGYRVGLPRPGRRGALDRRHPRRPGPG